MALLDTAPWPAFDEASLKAFSIELRQIQGVLAADSALNEAQTESELIEPVLALLGWDHLPQINLSESGREDVPDFLLFADAAAKARSLSESADDRRARHGIALVKAKRWQRVLDRNADDGVLVHQTWIPPQCNHNGLLPARERATLRHAHHCD